MDRKSRRRGALSAALFSRSEPHREGLGKAQAVAPRGQGQKQTNTRSGHHRASAIHHSRQCKGLVQTCSQRSTVKQKNALDGTNPVVPARNFGNLVELAENAVFREPNSVEWVK